MPRGRHEVERGTSTVTAGDLRWSESSIPVGIFLAIFTYACSVTAAPQKGEEVKIVSQTIEVLPDGGYKWSYEASNGIKAQETGTLQKASKPGEEDSISAQGGFSYPDKDAGEISLTYKAGPDGFQPQGAHLPTPPPIPPAILKSLEYNAAHPEQDEKPQGKQGK